MVIAMYGHGTEAEIEYIKDLERRNCQEPNPDSMLELAVLYIEPVHREDEAIKLLEDLLESDPSNQRAKLWLAYCCIHYLMDKPALERAIALSRPLEEDSEIGGAATMLRVEAMEDASQLTEAEKVKLLEASVSRNPEWVANHERLAWAYEEAGKLEEAVSHIRRAIRNLELFEPGPASTEARVFEELITGRGQPQLQEDLNRYALELEARLVGG